MENKRLESVRGTLVDIGANRAFIRDFDKTVELKKLSADILAEMIGFRQYLTALISLSPFRVGYDVPALNKIRRLVKLQIESAEKWRSRNVEGYKESE